jgi:hypothetical protein
MLLNIFQKFKVCYITAMVCFLFFVDLTELIFKRCRMIITHEIEIWQVLKP